MPHDPPEAAELLDYFDSTYISGRLRQQNPAQNQAVRLVLTRSPPMFPPAIWNVHDVTVNGDARTNMCEGWNNNFFNLVGHAHPSIWRVIECKLLYLSPWCLCQKQPWWLMWRPNTAVTARRTASSKSEHWNVGCWHGSLNNRLKEFPVSILTFIWQERI
jgi:hypothetical protein